MEAAALFCLRAAVVVVALCGVVVVVLELSSYIARRWGG